MNERINPYRKVQRPYSLRGKALTPKTFWARVSLMVLAITMMSIGFFMIAGVI
ncbi:MAG: hypothetical protein SA339_08410 [Methanomassiliicoccus sp.]|nr:hypothetical protein [Methanomassiliicoccus sp.]